ncbi:MAG: hypothetical protein ACFBZ8_03745 [Opitutales bacterium]
MPKAPPYVRARRFVRSLPGKANLLRHWGWLHGLSDYPGDAIHVSSPRLERAGRYTRVVANVDGQPLWFESEDALLVPEPEAWGSALVAAAALSGRPLVMETPLCPVWRSNVERAVGLMHRWGKTAEVPGALNLLRERATPRRTAGDVREGTTASAICFTGGVDSFHALLQHREHLIALVFVHGFDITLADQARVAAWEPYLRAVAAALGVKAIVVRTNLREHRTLRRLDWVMLHGAALASVGHTLAGTVNELLIAASFNVHNMAPWGSHPELDPSWSSAHLRIRHTGEALWRREKLAQIADDPLVQAHLRVCWANLTSDLNCGRCEKCIRTLLSLAVQGRLEAFAHSFPQTPPLAERIRGIEPLRGFYVPVYEAFLGKGLSDELEAAIRSRLPTSTQSTAHADE